VTFESIKAKLSFNMVSFQLTTAHIFLPKRDEVTGEWKELHNEELHILYSSPNIIRRVKLGRMRWARYLARMGERGKCTSLWWES
jgi:hypothetical protein